MHGVEAGWWGADHKLHLNVRLTVLTGRSLVYDVYWPVTAISLADHDGLKGTKPAHTHCGRLALVR